MCELILGWVYRDKNQHGKSQFSLKSHEMRCFLRMSGCKNTKNLFRMWSANIFNLSLRILWKLYFSIIVDKERNLNICNWPIYFIWNKEKPYHCPFFAKLCSDLYLTISLIFLWKRRFLIFLCLLLMWID